MAIEQLALTTSDGVSLEAERALPPDGRAVRAGMVLCHPHPLNGGTMRSIVISALFNALPDHGVSCLRFNFRGVEGSQGTHDRGDRERLDAIAAIDSLAAELPFEAPLILAGWSFGADVTLSVLDPRLAAWFAIAGPLKFARDLERAATDPRPKLLALAGRDEIRPPTEVQEAVASWRNTAVVVVPGASHFFIGSTDKLVALARDLVEDLAGASPRVSG
jgi:alpha/beta superfamily hydrolase